MIEMKQCHGGALDSKPFGSLRGIDLRLPNGSIYGLLGRGGAGKSACLRLLSGAQLPLTGEVRVNGFDTRREGLRVRSLVGYLPAGGGAHQDLTVTEYLSFLSEARGESDLRAARRIEELLEWVSLGKQKNALLSALTPGERRLCELAGAALGGVEFLLLDSPFGEMTSAVSEHVKAMIRTLGEGRTVVIADRRPERLIGLAEEILLLDEGRLVGRFEASDPMLTERYREICAKGSEGASARRSDAAPKKKASGRLGLLTEKAEDKYEEIDAEGDTGEGKGR